MFADTLIVFCFRQNLIVLTICQNKYRALDAAQELLDHHLTRSIAKHAAQHLLQFFLGFFEGRENEHTLTSTKAIGLQYVGWFESF